MEGETGKYKREEEERKGGQVSVWLRLRPAWRPLPAPLTCWNCGELRVLWISWPLGGRLSPLGRKGSSLCCTSALLRMGAIISGVHTLARSTAVRREGEGEGKGSVASSSSSPT